MSRHQVHFVSSQGQSQGLLQSDFTKVKSNRRNAAAGDLSQYFAWAKYRLKSKGKNGKKINYFFILFYIKEGLRRILRSVGHQLRTTSYCVAA